LDRHPPHFSTAVYTRQGEYNPRLSKENQRRQIN